MLTAPLIRDFSAKELVKKDDLSIKYNRLFEDNRDLISSLQYASTIQHGSLPQKRHFERLFEEYFIMYRPQKIVSGDFYWIGQKDNKIYFSLADCTGHGVSGAMLSMLGTGLLNYVVLGKKYDNPGRMLREIDKKWVETFSNGHETKYNNDWMDISLCSFDIYTRELTFSGARADVLIITEDNNVEVLKGNPYPIGGWQITEKRRYEVQTKVLPLNTRIYVGSDGFKDQIGGPIQKKFSSKRLVEFISDIAYVPMPLQDKLLNMYFDEWKGLGTQTDDVSIMGLLL